MRERKTGGEMRERERQGAKDEREMREREKDRERNEREKDRAREGEREGEKERAHTVFSGHVDVEEEAVLALVLDVGDHRVQVGREPDAQHVVEQEAVLQELRADGGELRGVADARPGQGRLGRLEAVLAGSEGTEARSGR